MKLRKSWNKKIRGATKVVVDNIEFDSILEGESYKILRDSGLLFTIKPVKYKITGSIKPGDKVRLVAPKKIKAGVYSKELYEVTRTQSATTLTPDFEVRKDNYIMIIEVKGNPNDSYPIKRKLLLELLNNMDDNYKYIYFETHTLKQLKEVIEIIKEI